MPEISALTIAITAAIAAIGAVAAWIVRGKRSQVEKDAVHAGWQEQITAQHSEHERLTEQNKALMEQISQYQASNIDVKNRAKELSAAILKANEKRAQLQREIKDIRANLEKSVNEREQLQSGLGAKASKDSAEKAKDARIKVLQIELEKWQNRLPPLIEKFRERNQQADQFEAELSDARQRIAELELETAESSTRIEPVQYPDELTDGRDASNETIEEELSEEGLSDNGSEAQLNDARDKLQAIKGIGPAIEKTLNEMGIFRYQQIADMSEYEIDRVANRLKGFRSRIYREDWIGQARDLHDQNLSG